MNLPFVHAATSWEAIADRVGDEAALIHGDRRISWREFDQRAARLATAFLAAGLGPGSAVAIDMYNCNEWLETFFAAIKIRAVPANVNYRYLDSELIHLLADSKAQAIVFHSSLTHAVMRVRPKLPDVSLFVRVQEGDSPASPIAGVAEYEALIAASAPALRIERYPDDQYLGYTGGTTGLPKGVMVNVGRLGASMSFIGPTLGLSADELADPVGTAEKTRRERRRVVAIPASPIMHSTGLGMAAAPALNYGGTVVTLPSRSFSAAELIDAVERHRVALVTIVGDAIGRPIVRALEEDAARGRQRDLSSLRPDLSSLRLMASAGVAWSAETKAALLRFMPGLTLLDACGASEGVNYGSRSYRKGDSLSGTRFVPAPGLMFLDENGRPQPAAPGVTGLLAISTVGSSRVDLQACKLEYSIVSPK